MRAYSSFRSIFTEPQVKTRCVTFLKSQGNNANWNANGFESETPFSLKDLFLWRWELVEEDRLFRINENFVLKFSTIVINAILIHRLIHRSFFQRFIYIYILNKTSVISKGRIEEIEGKKIKDQRFAVSWRILCLA